MQPGESGYLATYGVQLTLVDSIDKLDSFKRWAGEQRAGGVLGVDTETTGLRPDVDRVRLIQFGDLKQGWAIPWDGWWGGAMEVLRRYEGELVLHNSKFDERSIVSNLERSLGRGWKWPWHRTHDTMAMAHLVNSLRPKGLKPLGALLVDPQAIAAQRMLDEGMAKNKWSWATVPIDFPPYWIYGAMDPVLTAHIYQHLAPVVFERYRTPYELEMATTSVVAGMERNGLRVDVGAAELKREELLDFTYKARAWLQDRHGISNPTPQQLIKFFTNAGVPLLPKRTKGGKQAMDKEVLSAVQHPVAETVLNIRKAEKLVGTYIGNLLDFRDQDDRVHANFWTMGTRTARMTIEAPALQTLPKRDKTIRKLLIPSEGYSFISFDADQIEARLMAHFAGSQTMIDAFHSPDDFFCRLVQGVYATDHLPEKDDPRRQLMKGMTYGKIYGGGVDTLAAVAGVTPDVMSSALMKFDRAYPEVNALQSKLRRLAAERWQKEGEPYVVTPTGRRLVGDEDKDYVMTNYLIQGHAAEILKRGVVALDSALPDEVRLLLLVHDEIVMEAPTEMVQDLAPVIKETLDDLDGYRVPITWGGGYSETNWGELIEW